MRIAINTRFLLKNKMEGFGWFTYEVTKRMVESHPEIDFFFFFDRKFDEKFIFADNVTPVILSPPARHPILFKIWFNWSVTKALKKYEIDLFLSPDGYLSLKTDIPQIGVIHDLNFEHYPDDLPTSAYRYLKKYFPLFAKKANHLITVSHFSKEDIVNRYQIPSEKITVAHNGGSEAYLPISDIEKSAIREKYTDGHPYFLFVGALHPRKNLKRLAKAYDQFKEKTGSTTKLLVVGASLWKNDDTKAYFDQLNFSTDILFVGHQKLEELTQIMASAKALVFPSYFEGFGIPLIEAMRAECPIICGNRTSLPEVAGDAALLFNPFDIEEIQSALERIDLDETLRKSLIEKGKVQCIDFTWDRSATIIWDAIARVLKDNS